MNESTEKPKLNPKLVDKDTTFEPVRSESFSPIPSLQDKEITEEWIARASKEIAETLIKQFETCPEFIRIANNLLKTTAP